MREDTHLEMPAVTVEAGSAPRFLTMEDVLKTVFQGVYYSKIRVDMISYYLLNHTMQYALCICLCMCALACHKCQK